jgi:hypothetical protein
MSPLLEKSIACLAGDNSSATQKAIVLIGEVAVFNRKRVRSDVCPEANEEHLSAEDIKTLERSLIDLVERDPFGPDAASAIWCLSKFGDTGVIAKYRMWLRCYVDHLQPSGFALGQILAALSDLGEKAVIGGSFSADEFGKNFDTAVAYLKRQSD